MAEALAYEAQPQCCPSLYFHLPTCPKTHPEIAALPMLMPKGVTVPAIRGRVFIRQPRDKSISPGEARAVARELLLSAAEAERQEAFDVA